MCGLDGPPSLECRPGALLFLTQQKAANPTEANPPLTEAMRPVAVLPPPPLTEASHPLAVLKAPPLTADSWPIAMLP